MRETLVDFLINFDRSYQIKGSCLRRPDNSVVAVYSGEKWIVTGIYPHEMALYGLFSGRGFPSKLCDRDLTNIGHI